MAKTCQLFSGSSGNSIFIKDGNTKILVDAGVSAKRIEEALSYIDEDASKLSAIFVTHEHIDHSYGLRVLGARYDIPVFSSEKIISKLYSEGKLAEKNTTEIIEDNMELGGIEILPFELYHDSVQCFGYRFNLKDSKSISVCTDTGFVTAAAKRVIPKSDLVFLESNHEITMLENGPYPYMLKQRILSRKGHLSNADCAEFACELVESGTKRIVLSQISKENNLPEIARLTAVSALGDRGFTEDKDYRISTSPQINDKRAIII